MDKKIPVYYFLILLFFFGFQCLDQNKKNLNQSLFEKDIDNKKEKVQKEDPQKQEEEEDSQEKEETQEEDPKMQEEKEGSQEEEETQEEDLKMQEEKEGLQEEEKVQEEDPKKKKPKRKNLFQRGIHKINKRTREGVRKVKEEFIQMGNRYKKLSKQALASLLQFVVVS